MSKKLTKIYGKVFLTLGIILTAITVYPIGEYIYYKRLNIEELVSPVKEFSLNSQDDMQNAKNWFSDSGGFWKEENKGFSYSLSIEKLKIENAQVVVGEEDLSKSLIHFPGTALPGELGNSVIFGHSILPIFFNPKNYLSIFSNLYKLIPGDRIQIQSDGVSYTYKVEKLFEVAPTDLDILVQSNSDSHLTLVTCSPPGDPRKPKRLIVRAKI